MNQGDAAVAQVGSRSRWSVRRAIRWLIAIPALIVLYYAVGTWAYYRVGDDQAFEPPQPTAGGSRAVDMAAALIEREAVAHAWQPPDPYFWPNGLLIHPAAFQRGLQGALARFSIELERTRSAAPAAPPSPTPTSPGRAA